ncbi:putative leucine-rich repeat-containing protein DDB_G0290503 [Melanaphis sacchari]|uniref:putative leucine-rich repeat-containing protein DDB_G0290503 n=1 Tax=Melanaphis sacchari TaxID=742174 RepID=UPI000DC14345|nr:putative leucine-rich repeat-containing protein DDB_G0290503 [Melanaphis sacchari]
MTLITGLRNMCSKDTTQELTEIISFQKKKICKLNKMLEEFDAVVSERDSLQKLCKQFEQSKEDNYNGHKKALNELLATCDIQSEKLKKAADLEYKWEHRYGELEDANNYLNRQLKAAKCNENKLQLQLTETETTLKCVERELCTTQSELEEKNQMVNKLKKNLKCNEQELCKVRKEFEECKNECNKLNETNRMLNMDLKCTKKSLYDTKLSANRMEERFRQEREHLSNELKISCKKFNDLEIRYDEAMCKLNEERCKSKKFASKLIEVNKVTVKNYLEMKNRIQKLQEEICAKNNDLGSLKEKNLQLQQENESKCTETSTLKNKLYERECQLKQMCLLSEKIEQIKCNIEAYCCPKKCGNNPCCCPKKKCETTSSCPTKKCETDPCCPIKKCEITPSCPTEKCETNPCCPTKKCENSCRTANSTTDMKFTCGLSTNTRAVIQKYAKKSCDSCNDEYKMELKKLKCDLDDLQQSIGYVS